MKGLLAVQITLYPFDARLVETRAAGEDPERVAAPLDRCEKGVADKARGSGQCHRYGHDAGVLRVGRFGDPVLIPARTLKKSLAGGRAGQLAGGGSGQRMRRYQLNQAADTESFINESL